MRHAIRRIAIFFCFTLSLAVLSNLAEAQTFTVLYTFNVDANGYNPLAGLTMDSAGNLYGTTNQGGLPAGNGFGVVYKLSHHGAGWIFSKLISLTYASGCAPNSKVVVGPNGTLYGTGAQCGATQYGTIFNLRPSPTICPAVQCPWEITVLHAFNPNTDGAYPNTINFDNAGNFYGTTSQGGPLGEGTVFEMTPSDGSWTFSVLTDFSGTSAGQPYGGVVPDAGGNLWGGGRDPYPGSVFEVTNTGSTRVLHEFDYNDGVLPLYGFLLDGDGNVYGQTDSGGTGSDGGTVFELSPSGNNWIFDLLYSLPGMTINSGQIGAAALTMDAQGNLYGTTYNTGAYGYGSVFKLNPSANGWIYTDLHDFTGPDDGAFPWSDVSIDSQGNLYGTASQGGLHEAGTVWEITP
jgi:uncharacterized repeat protein (TIGR03803 family)